MIDVYAVVVPDTHIWPWFAALIAAYCAGRWLAAR